MADVRMQQQWMRCPTCLGYGHVYSISVTTPPTTCPQCYGECRVGNYWFGIAIPGPALSRPPAPVTDNDDDKTTP